MEVFKNNIKLDAFIDHNGRILNLDFIFLQKKYEINSLETNKPLSYYINE